MKRKLRNIATVLLCVVIFLSSTLGLVMMTIDNVCASSGKLGLSAATPAYSLLMCDTVNEKLEKKMALVAITVDDISDIITADEIRRAAPEAAVILAKRLLGVTEEEWKYENEKLRVRINDKLNAYAEENGIEYKEGSADEVYDLICDTVSDELNVVSQNYVEKVSPAFVIVSSICSYWMLPVAVFILSFAAVIIIGRRHVKRTIYNALIPAYLSAFTVFAMATVIYNRDYLSKTVLENGTLRYYLRSIFNSVLTDIRQVSGTFVIIYLFAAALIIAGIIIDRRKKKKKKKKHSHRPRHDKNKPFIRHPAQMKPKVQPEELSVDEIIRINEEALEEGYTSESPEDIARDFYMDADEDVGVSDGTESDEKA